MAHPTETTKHCCPVKKTKTSQKRFFFGLSFISAFSAFGLAGIGCLRCLPFIGAMIAGSSVALLLDQHLVLLRVSLFAVSIACGVIYFFKVGRPSLTLLFFKECPSYAILKKILLDQNISSLKEIDIEKLPDNHPLRSYSSPSLLSGKKIIFGARTSNSAMSCSMVSHEEMLLAVEKMQRN